jgi:Ubiquitin carboxyl-terminal hydrolase
VAGLQAPRKLATPVSFPVDALLDMRPFLSSSVLAQRCGLRLQEAEQDTAEDMAEEGDAPPAALYRAYAVVCHHGNMQGGHYTAYIRCAAGWLMSGSCALNLEGRTLFERYAMLSIARGQRIVPQRVVCSNPCTPHILVLQTGA